MCCFSQPVEKVSDTQIFARSSKGPRQFLVYSMEMRASQDLAMILPLPTPENSPENALKFLDLTKVSDFFKKTATLFPQPQPRGLAGARTLSAPVDSKKLVVKQVGSFEASFVPTVRDFSRLDERFRLPVDTWSALGPYAKYGFAVFKLRKGASKVHPMAFEFPRKDRRKLFFPTVHIHDGKVHKSANFDHTLYCQLAEDEFRPLARWRESVRPLGFALDAKKCHGIIDADAHAYQFKIRGRKKNVDVWV